MGSPSVVALGCPAPGPTPPPHMELDRETGESQPAICRRQCLEGTHTAGDPPVLKERQPIGHSDLQTPCKTETE